MSEVYLIMRRTDIPDGVLQVVDLWPNTSSKNYIYPPGLGQTGYIHNIPNNLVVSGISAGPPVVATSDLSGVAAYLIGNVDTGAAPGGAVLTGAQAELAANLIVALVLAGSPISLANVNGILGAIVAGTTLTAGGSTGVLTELLSVMAGAGYLIPAGTTISATGLFTGRVGAFVAGVYKQLYDIGQFKCSNLNGNVSLLKSANFTYDGMTGAAVTVYSSTGTVL